MAGTIHQYGHNQCTRVVIGGITFQAVWQRKDGMLQDACVVRHAEKVLCVQCRQIV